jgi:uncharacterized protein (TIGR02246 family)
MRQVNCAAAFLMIIALAGCSSTSPPPDAVADEVKAAIAIQVNAYAARDLDAMMGVMAPDYLWISSGQPNVSGDEAVRAGVAAQFADPALALSVSDETVEVAKSGDMAVYHSIYSYTYTDAETQTPTTQTGNWVAVFRRQEDGSMKLARDLIVALPDADE